MVTQASRLALAQRAIGDYCAQTHAARELIVVHDGDAATDAALRALATAASGAVRVLREAPGRTLGALRNAAVAAAAGEFVCQWDDDDRCHPERLALQWRALRAHDAEFCFLSDQLHWFAIRNEMYWDDWHGEPYPLNVVQGTLLGRRSRMPAYPDQRRGEDTAVLHEIVRRGCSVARLRDAGWCYVYVCHGDNAWDHEHHAAITRAKRYGSARLLQREALLRQRLAEYRPAFGALRFPLDGGCLTIASCGPESGAGAAAAGD